MSETRLSTPFNKILATPLSRWYLFMRQNRIILDYKLRGELKMSGEGGELKFLRNGLEEVRLYLQV